MQENFDKEFDEKKWKLEYNERIFPYKITLV